MTLTVPTCGVPSRHTGSGVTSLFFFFFWLPVANDEARALHRGEVEIRNMGISKNAMVCQQESHHSTSHRKPLEAKELEERRWTPGRPPATTRLPACPLARIGRFV